jgi:hypothetical protein
MLRLSLIALISTETGDRKSLEKSPIARVFAKTGEGHRWQDYPALLAQSQAISSFPPVHGLCSGL